MNQNPDNEMPDKCMTDQEINEAVARKLGKTLIDIPERGPMIDMHYGAGNIPDYCCSIAAAWVIVENIRKDRDKTIFLSLKGHHACCRISQESYSFDPDNDLANAENVCDNGNPLPMAICLAYLKLP
jgi:hypothetical protein